MVSPIGCAHAGVMTAPRSSGSRPVSRARWALLLAGAVLGVLLGSTGPATAAVAVVDGAPAATAAAAYVPPAGSASVRLPDGRFLVVGGCAPGHCPATVTTAVIYNSTTGQAVPTGSTVTAHAYATLTRLTSGKALLAGGCSGRLCGHLNPTAEVWDPATGTWTVTGSMLGDPQSGISPVHASAVLLASGQVLVAGGVNYSAVAQVWDPATGRWQATNPMRAPRESFTLTTLTSGLVLAAGGCDYYYCETVLNSAELYHPATRTWTATGSLTQARYGHTARLLRTGQVQVTNGITASGAPATLTELYNPASGTWSHTK